MSIIDKLGKEYLIFDGAMGTMLQREGIETGKIPEEYNIERPDIIKKIHRSYIDAGANIISSNTFGANRYKLESSKYTVTEIVKAGVGIAKSVGDNHLVALDMGPIGQLLEPLGTLSFDDAYDYYKEQIIAGVNAGADIVLIETISDLYEARAAILAAKENSNLPIFCTMTFDENKRTLTGSDTTTMVQVLEGLGVDALGVNCSLGPKQIKDIVEDICSVARKPVMVQPNAGLPTLEDGKTVYSLSSGEYASDIADIAMVGGAIFGGCCGTDPTYIKDMISILNGKKPVIRYNKKLTTATSSTKTVVFDKDIVVIGERINPTGKKRLKTAIRDGENGYIIGEALRQIECGADVLDVNLGIPDVNEEEKMVEIVKELQSIISTPLQIDSMKAKVIEKAVRYYNGRPIINSVNGKQSSMDKILPIAKKYGALIIGLTLDERGLPKNVEQRVEIAERIINEAKSYGIEEEDIIIDCLTLTASAEQAAVMDTLEAIRIIKSKYRVRATLGASNISFGLPNRSILNSTFLTMALTYGLDCPITDPTVTELMDSIRAFRVLANIDKGCESYIDAYGEQDKKPKASLAPDNDKDIIEIITRGLKDLVQAKTKELLGEFEPMYIINEHLIKALDIVGQRYEEGKIFLPQLIRSAETVKLAFGVLKQQLDDSDSEIEKGKIIVATVKGDVHDIGKNIVKILLENYGYRVIDLGKDVSKEDIYKKIDEEDIKLVGLSALMTTTVNHMEETIKYIRERKPEVSIMVGGAVLTPQYAHKIGANYYGRDAREAVNIAQTVFQ